MSWLEQSIMHLRGVARGRVGSTQRQSEEVQGRCLHTIASPSEPVLHIEPGDRVALNPTGRMGTPEEVARRPAACSSEQARRALQSSASDWSRRSIQPRGLRVMPMRS